MRGSDRVVMAVAFGLLAPSVAGADRLPAAVLWLDTPRPEMARAIEGALVASPALKPIDDADARRILVEGGPATRVAQHLATGRERFAALRDLDQADAELAEAEQIALAEMKRAEACPELVGIERLRLRYAELVHLEPAAARAAVLLGACLASPAAEDAAAIARHPGLPPVTAAPLRVESEPAGAEVLLDLRPIGKTPLALPAARRADAFLDVELAGHRKVHRALSAADSGVLAVAMARDSELGDRVDRLRAAAGNGADADFAELARRLGAARLAVVRSDGAPPAAKLQVRVFDSATAGWTQAPSSFSAATDDAAVATTSGQIAALAAAPPEPMHGGPHTEAGRIASLTAPGAVVPPALPNPKTDGGTPAYKKWYTWVVAGGLLALVGGFVIAQHVGSDEITVHVTH